MTAVPSAVRLAYLLWPVVTVVIGQSLFYWIYRNQFERRGAKWFAVTLLFGGVWMGFMFLHFVLGDPWLQSVAAVGEVYAMFVSFGAHVVFISVYTGREFHKRRSIRVVLGGVLAGFFGLGLTNLLGVHQLLWRELRVVTEPFSYVVIDYTVVTVALLAVLLAVIGYSWVVMANYLLSTGSGSDTQVLMVLLGALSIGVAELVGAAGLTPAVGYHHASFGALPYVVFSTFGLFRFDLLDVLPVARNAVVEHLTDPVLVLNDEHHVVDFNDRARRTWPDLPEQKGAPFEVAFPTLADHLALPGDGSETTTGQVTLTRDGAERHYSVTVTGIAHGRSGAVGWYAILLRDVTELERSRWQLQRQNERLDQVASTISHDLRNPISVASGYTESLAIDVAEWDLDPDQREVATEKLGKTRDSLGRMEDIIDDILAIAREGKTVEDTETVSLDAVAREAWGNVDTGAADLSVVDDRSLRADRSKLLTVFENLLRNAVEHGPDDVTVEVGPTIDGFSVADDGPGIPPEHRDGIFEYGYTTSSTGTGLGLSIVKTMAESHGWTVELDGDYEDGTRFVFRDVARAGFGGDADGHTSVS